MQDQRNKMFYLKHSSHTYEPSTLSLNCRFSWGIERDSGFPITCTFLLFLVCFPTDGPNSSQGLEECKMNSTVWARYSNFNRMRVGYLIKGHCLYISIYFCIVQSVLFHFLWIYPKGEDFQLRKLDVLIEAQYNS